MLSQRMVVFNATFRDIETLLPRARESMGGGASNEVVHRVARHNPDSFWGVARRERYAAGETEAEGFVAFLMLNEEGADLLLDGEFDATDPPLHLLTRQHEKPAAIYCWGVYAPGAIAGGVPLTLEKTWTPLYRDAPLLARAVTLEGCSAFGEASAFGAVRHSGERSHRISTCIRAARRSRRRVRSMTIISVSTTKTMSRSRWCARSRISCASCRFAARPTSPSRIVPTRRSSTATIFRRAIC